MRNMPIITAMEALRRTMSRDKQIAKTIENWTEKFNSQVDKTAAGSNSRAGETWMFFELSAGSEMLLSAKEVFISQVRAEGFNVTMHDSNDDNDYFVYRVDWSGKA